MSVRPAIVWVLALALAAPAAAQDRMAYLNVEAVLNLMPETQTALAGVDSLGRKLSGDLKVKEAYAQKKYEEARQAQASGAPDATLNKFRTELQGLEDEIRHDAEAADNRLAEHRAKVVAPVLEKLETHIRAVAQEEGYTFVFNSMDGQGNSIVLYGAEDRDITKKVLTHMGIPIPDESAPAKPGAKQNAGSGAKKPAPKKK